MPKLGQADPIEAVEALFAGASADAPGYAVGVVRNGAVVFARCWGLANLEHQVPIKPTSRFYLASVSKQVAALAVLMACEDGLLDLHGSIRQALPELPDHMEAVTIHHLLTHTGGVRDYLELGRLAGFGPEHPWTEAEVIRLLGRQRGLDFDPGADFSYSNSGYVLAAMALARVAGQSLDDFAHDRIFNPLGMAGSRFQHHHGDIVPDKASGYARQENGSWRVADSHLDVVADGGMYASLDDMLAWTANLLAPRVGGEALQRMQTPVTLSGGASTGYGMGFQLGRHRGLPVTEHSGSHGGYRAHLLVLPTADLGVVVLSNDAAALPVVTARYVAAAVLGDRLPPRPTELAQPPLQTLQALSGPYRSAGGEVIALTLGDEGLLNLLGMPLAAVAPHAFALQVDPDNLRLDFDPADGAFILTRAGPPRRYARCAPPATLDPAHFCGDYQSRDIGPAVCRIRQGGEALTVTFAEGPPVKLQSIGDDTLWAPDLGVALTFEPTTAGGFRLDGGRIRGLAYARVTDTL